MVRSRLTEWFLAASVSSLFIAGCASSPSGAPAQDPEPAQNTVEQSQPEQEPMQEESSAATETSDSMESMESADQYTVVRGDNLWNISAKSEVYSDPFQWPLIYKANTDKIEDADLIYPGQELNIDRSASGADVSAAIDHAKTRGSWSLGAVEATDKAYLAR